MPLVFVVAAVVGCGGWAAVAAGDSAQPGATAQCRDGTYSFPQGRSGACSHHRVEARWLTGSGSSSSTAGSGAVCGTERWTVKTLQDRPTLLPARSTTIAFLTSRPAPASLPDTRLPFERHVFLVVARVTLVRREANSDLRLVLEDAAGRTMIAEAPLAACAPRATVATRRKMATARAAVRLCTRAVVTGVAFFDFQHGQPGAPNAIELHPILAFRCLVITP